MRKFNNEKSFSLIEILVVLAIIVILTAVVFANYGPGRRKLALNRSAYQMAQGLRIAQEMAMATERVSCGGDAIATGFGVFIGHNWGSGTNDSNSYVLFADCNGDNYINTGDIILDTVNLEKGIVATLYPDINGDGQVELADLIALSRQYCKKEKEKCCYEPDWCQGADLNRDGKAELEDLIAITRQYGKTGISIVFRSPDPETYIYLMQGSSSTEVNGGEIKVRWKEGALYRKFVEINKIGLINIIGSK